MSYFPENRLIDRFTRPGAVFLAVKSPYFSTFLRKVPESRVWHWGPKRIPVRPQFHVLAWWAPIGHPGDTECGTRTVGVGVYPGRCTYRQGCTKHIRIGVGTIWHMHHTPISLISSIFDDFHRKSMKFDEFQCIYSRKHGPGTGYTLDQVHPGP